MPKIFLPTPLRPFADGASSVEAPGATVAEVLEALVSRHANLRAHLFDEAGKLRSFVNVYKNDEDIRHLDRESTAVATGDALSIVPSIAGGSPPASAGLDAAALTREELQRYARHLILPEVGPEGQAKLKASRVLLVGAGGLGSPAALYLAAAGVGTLGLVDFDVVDESNLHRQILFGTSDVGRPKLEAAAARLKRRQSERSHRAVRGAADVGERAPHLRGLRHRRRRHGQLSDALSRQRRLRAPRQAQRLRLDLSLRGAGLGLRGEGRALLSLPLRRAAAPGPRAVVRRGGSARRAARAPRRDPGERDRQAHPLASASRSSDGSCSSTPWRCGSAS